jgi:septum site-determining protein MinD
MAKRLVVTSGKGGVGKTTVAAMLGACLAKKGARVVLCDADFGLNSLDVFCGVEGQITYDVVDVVEGKCRAKQALVKHPSFSNLYILTSRRQDGEKYVSAQALKLVLDGLQAEFDYVIVDSPAGLEDGFHRAVAPCEEAIVVTAPYLAAIRDADKTVAMLKKYALEKVWLVVNRVQGDLVLRGKQLGAEEISEVLKTPLIGVIPDDYELPIAGAEYLPKPFKLLAETVRTGKVRLYNPIQKYSGFFGPLKRALKRRL